MLRCGDTGHWRINQGAGRGWQIFMCCSQHNWPPAQPRHTEAQMRWDTLMICFVLSKLMIMGDVTPWRRAPKIDCVWYYITCISSLQFKILVICSHLSHVAAAPGYEAATSWSRTPATASIQLQLPGLGWAALCWQIETRPAACVGAKLSRLSQTLDIIYSVDV